MKIEIGDFVLCAGGEQSPEADQEVNAQAVLQVVEPTGGVAAKAFNRGNLARTHTFQVTRTYVSIAAAERALFEHPTEVPTKGDIVITFEPCDETAPYVTLADATCHAFAAKQIGLSIVWRYTITSGATEITDPSAP